MAASVWCELSSLPGGEKLLDRYGLGASRWAGAQLAGRALAQTWLLDKKGFRRALSRELPPAHDVIDIAGDPRSERRASRAARAYDRTLSAARNLELPELPTTSRILVWTSPVIRPRGVELPFLARSLEVEPTPELVRQAIGELWASVYFAECLREIRALSLKRVELATGLSFLPERASAEELAVLSLLEVEEPLRAAVPVPGRSGQSRGESELELSLGHIEVEAFRTSLGARYRRLPQDLVSQGPCRWELGVDALGASMPPRALHERLALSHLTGVAPVQNGQGASVMPARLALARTVGQETLRQTTLAARVRGHERAVGFAVSALSEMDLAVLPDDGLKRTLEDAGRLFRENADIASEALLSSALLVAGSEQLDPESRLAVDAGLEGLVWIPVLTAWEERLAVVRNDAACVAALLSRAPLPEGAGRRALIEAERTLGHFRPDPLDPYSQAEESSTPSAWLLDVARIAVLRSSSLGALCREARFAADRRLAALDSSRGHLLGLSLAGVRSLARDAVLLRETTRYLGLSVSVLLGRIAADVDRRLRRIEPGLPSGAAFECTLEELVEAVDLRGSSLQARVAWRRAERRRLRERKLEWWPPASRADGAAGSMSGEALSLGEARGATTELGALTASGAAGSGEGTPILMAEAFSPRLILALPFVGGLLVKRGSSEDSVAVVARALGIPVLASSELALATAPERVIVRASLRDAHCDWGARSDSIRTDSRASEAHGSL